MADQAEFLKKLVKEDLELGPTAFGKMLGMSPKTVWNYLNEGIPENKESIVAEALAIPLKIFQAALRGAELPATYRDPNAMYARRAGIDVRQVERFVWDEDQVLRSFKDFCMAPVYCQEQLLDKIDRHELEIMKELIQEALRREPNVMSIVAEKPTRKAAKKKP